MTDLEKYNELLKEIGAVLKSKNDEIYMLKAQIEYLKSKLDEAEKKAKAANQ